MHCTKCGREVAAGKKFCSGCGAPVSSSRSEPARPVVPQASPGDIAAAAAPPRTVIPDRDDRQARPGKSDMKPKPAAGKKEWPDFSRKKEEKHAAPKAATAAKNMLGLLTVGLPKLRTMLPGRLKFAAPVAIALVVIALIIAARSCSGPRRTAAPDDGRQPVENFVPQGFRLLDVTVTDDKFETKVDVRVELGKQEVEEEQLELAMRELLEHWRARTGFTHRRHPNRVEIRVYSAESTFRNDPEWWLSRLYWADGGKESVDFQMEALLPRHIAMGYTGLTRDEYVKKSDEVSKEVYGAMSEILKLIKDYETQMIDETAMRDKSLEQAKILISATEVLPEPPWNDCVRINELFVAIIEDTYYFQDLFGPDTTLFSGRRLNLEEVRLEIELFFTDFKEYRAERSNYQ